MLLKAPPYTGLVVVAQQPLSPATVTTQPVAPAVPNRPSGEDATEMAAFKFVK